MVVILILATAVDYDDEVSPIGKLEDKLEGDNVEAATDGWLDWDA